MLLAAIGCLAVVVYVGIRTHNLRGPSGLDLRTARPVFWQVLGFSVVSTRAAIRYEQLGSAVPFALLVAGLVGVAALMKDWVSVLVALAGPASALVLTEYLFKPLFGRSAGHNYSFPSGHTAALTALAAVMVLLAARRWGRKGAAVAVPLGSLISGLMVLTVVRLRYHFMSDALAGALLGIATVLAAALVASHLFERFGRQPA